MTLVSKIVESGGAEQSSSLVMNATARNASGRRKPTFDAGVVPRKPSATAADAS